MPKELTPKGRLLYDALHSNPQESMEMLRASMLNVAPSQRDTVERAMLAPAEALVSGDVAGVGPSVDRSFDALAQNMIGMQASLDTSRAFITSAVASVFNENIEKMMAVTAARRAQAAAAPAAPAVAAPAVPTTRRASARLVKKEDHHSASESSGADVNDVLRGGQKKKEKATERRP